MRSDGWSETLIQQTRSMLQTLPLTADGYVALKNSDGRFGRVSLNDLVAGEYAVEDRSTGELRRYASVDELIADGWVID
ncbi:hypothetical protein [Cupriavidus basilensis]|uniref:Uncharacterized protein n=1 Tax=Cupriavidus basilensis TaxID=68895 RepID=A0A643FXA8_9BURK|nr:hypothetical protein [Cupriavidus basilensis]QOT76584.1 hypothetical protein F7R26_000250 [Cupriavidus basilensis]